MLPSQPTRLLPCFSKRAHILYASFAVVSFSSFEVQPSAHSLSVITTTTSNVFTPIHPTFPPKTVHRVYQIAAFTMEAAISALLLHAGTADQDLLLDFDFDNPAINGLPHHLQVLLQILAAIRGTPRQCDLARVNLAQQFYSATLSASDLRPIELFPKVNKFRHTALLFSTGHRPSTSASGHNTGLSKLSP